MRPHLTRPLTRVASWLRKTLTPDPDLKHLDDGVCRPKFGDDDPWDVWSDE